MSGPAAVCARRLVAAAPVPDPVPQRMRRQRRTEMQAAAVCAGRLVAAVPVPDPVLQRMRRQWWAEVQAAAG